MRSYYKGVARDQYGAIIGGATIAIYLAGTTTVASVYTVSIGGTAVNSVIADIEGVFYFYVDTSDYSNIQLFKLVISYLGNTATYDNISAFYYDNYYIDALGEYGSGTAYTQATISAALTAIGTVNKATLLLRPGTWAISADLTVPANVTLKLPAGAVMQVATGKTLTINGAFDAGLYQVFDCVGTGSVIISQNRIALATNYQWFGLTTPSNVTLYVPTDFSTISDVLTHIQNYFIPENAVLTISVEAGIYTSASRITIKHPCGKQIKIVGSTPVTTTLTSIGAVSGSAGDWSIPITVSDATGMTANQYAIVKNVTGTGDYHSLNGVWKITDITGSVVTVTNTNKKAVFPTFTGTGGDVVVPQTVLNMASYGLCAFNSTVGELKNVILQSTAATGYGIHTLGSGSHITIGDNVGVSGFHCGVRADESSSMSGNTIYVSGATAHGIMALKSSVIDFGAQMVTNGNGFSGVAANTGAEVVAFGIVACGNGANGIWADGNAMIYTYGDHTTVAAIVKSNMEDGVLAQYGGTIKLENALVSLNGRNGVNAVSGMVNVNGVTTSYNTESGFAASAGGTLIGTSPISTHNTWCGIDLSTGGIAVFSGVPEFTYNRIIGVYADYNSIAIVPSSLSNNNSGFGYYAKNKAYIYAASSTSASNGTGDYIAYLGAYINTVGVVGTPAKVFHPQLIMQTDPNNWSTGAATLTIEAMLKGINVGTPSSPLNYTLPTGANCEAGGIGLAVYESFDWHLINLSGANAITVVANTDHTVVGNMVVAVSTSATFRTRKTATNTFVTYRIN